MVPFFCHGRLVVPGMRIAKTLNITVDRISQDG